MRLSMLYFMLCFLPLGSGQERNSSALLPEHTFVGPVLMAQIPRSTLVMDTGLAIRYALMLSIIGWNAFTVCDPAQTSLNFFGGNERLPTDVCGAPDSAGELYAYCFMRAVENEYPEPAASYAKLMLDNGYDPEDRTVDNSTAIGMGNIIGMKLAEWMGKDGWNSRGDLTRENFRKPFEDYTRYRPVNIAHELKYPLRWQPLIDADPKFGRFTVQEHVIPFLGYTKPYLLSSEELVSKHVEMPYIDINATDLSGDDAQIMDKLVWQVVQASANSTADERALAEWFDNKFMSLGTFVLGYNSMLGFKESFFHRWFLGESLAQYDSILLAWKEKRRIDAVRPRSIIRNFYANENFQAFVNPEIGVTSVRGRDWEPIVITQPHSEYPSASAAVCTAFANHATLMLKEYAQENGVSKVPGITLPQNRLFKGSHRFYFETIEEAGRTCGMSRVWAGVHFPPAVPSGELLAEGVGEAAYEFVKELSEGKIPSRCWWCST